MTTTIERSVELDVPVRPAYDQWTQFEDFPLFIDGVEGIEQATDDRLAWTVRRRGVERTWQARITEQHPDLRIAWESVEGEGPTHSGVLTFHRLDDEHSRIMVQFRFEPEGFFEQYADKTNLIERWVDDALKSFKDFIETRGRPTGAWRGTIERGGITRDSKVTRDDVAHDTGQRSPEHTAIDHRA